MKKNVILLMAILCSVLAFAQNSNYKWGVGIGGGISQYQGDHGWSFYDLGKVTKGHVMLEANRYLNPTFDLSLNASYGGLGYDRTQIPISSFESNHLQAHLALRFKFNNGYFTKEDAIFAPYLFGGVGFVNNSGSNSGNSSGLTIPFGGALKFNVSERFYVTYQETFGPTLDDKGDNLEGYRKGNDWFLFHSFIVGYNFGGKPDEDGDGVPDEEDTCPGTEQGIEVDENGCPKDSDGDGIADYVDNCPSIAGHKSAQGCPDKDGDGIVDSEDDCPEEAGVSEHNGCNDTDGDGILDHEDKCPKTAGITQFEGCPDTDGDGIQDSEDACPNTKGLAALKGCPDKDGDGIADGDDKCPEVAGIKANKGCPEVKEEVKKVFDQALKGVQFESGKDVIKSSSYGILDNVVTVMKDNPQFKLEINGHTDSQGDDAMNMELSKKRAAAVKKYLTDHGIEESRMTSEGFGETKPVDTNDTSAGRAKNRRVEFNVKF